MKASVFIATSIDGYIARENGDVDWLPEPDAAEDFGYQQFINNVDTIIMGRRTFEKVLSFDKWPFHNKPVIVLTRSSVDVPDDLQNQVQVTTYSPTQLIEHLANKGVEHVYVDGGTTIRSFLGAELIDTLVITQVPVILGSGIPLFKSLNKELQLKLNETKAFSNGLVQNHYSVL